MTIETLYDTIGLFEKKVIQSGFFRDVTDFIASLPNNQNNIVALREIAQNTKSGLQTIRESPLPDELANLFCRDQLRPFTETDSIGAFSELLEDPEIAVDAFFTQISQILTPLQRAVQVNIDEANRLKQVFEPYVGHRLEQIAEENTAVISLLFKDLETVSKLADFSKILQRWNRNLLLYHQVLKSTPPDDIEMVTVQNGSLDVVLNIDFDIAVNLIDLFKVGFRVYAAFLTYKSIAKPLVDTYLGNQKLIKQEKEREITMLENIGAAIVRKVEEQHSLARETDKQIESNSDKKIEQISSLVTSHIIKGNEMRIRALPEVEDSDVEEDDSVEPKENAIEELNKLSTEVKTKLEHLPEEDKKTLLEHYGQEPDEDSERK